jgi:iron complex transport system substrate-binding protein
MGQRRILGIAAILTAVLFCVVVASRWGKLSHESISADATQHSAIEPRVASITPAGTDLLIGIGAADHLVGISNYDDAREGTAGKPKVGDYQTIDWEKIAVVQPQVLVIQYADDRVPPGVAQRCDDLGIKLVNLKLDSLADVDREMIALADAVGEKSRGEIAADALKLRLQSVSDRVAGKPPVKAIIVTSDTGLNLAGPGEFLDELLTIAGGQNAAAGTGKPYPSVDREMLLQMSPDVIIQLIPDGDKSPQLLAAAKQFWDGLPDLPAVKNHRVYVLTDWYALQPGFRVGDLAAEFADRLHPETAIGARNLSAVTNPMTSAPITSPAMPSVPTLSIPSASPSTSLPTTSIPATSTPPTSPANLHPETQL